MSVILLCVFFWCIFCMCVYIVWYVVYVCSVCVCAHPYTYVIAQGPQNNIVIWSTILYFISLRKNLPLKFGVRQTISKSTASLPPLPMRCSSKYEHDHRQPLTIDIWLRSVCLPSNHSSTRAIFPAPKFSLILLWVRTTYYVLAYSYWLSLWFAGSSFIFSHLWLLPFCMTCILNCSLVKKNLWVNFTSVLFCSVLNIIERYFHERHIILAWKLFSFCKYILVLHKLSGHGQNAPKVFANILHKWLLPQLLIEPLVPSETSQARLSPSPWFPVLLSSRYLVQWPTKLCWHHSTGLSF